MKSKLPTRAKNYMPLVVRIAGTFVATSLLTYYILPNMPFDRFTPEHLVAYWVANSPSTCLSLAVVVFCFGGVWALSNRAQPAKGWVPLWLLTGFYLVPGLLEMIFWTNNITVYQNVTVTLTAVIVGVWCAWLCHDINCATQAISVLATVQAVITVFYEKIGHNTLLSGDINRAGGTFADPRSVCILMIVALPIALMRSLSCERIYEKTLYMLSTALLFAALILTWDRGAIVAAAISVVWMVFRFTSDKRLVVFASVFLALAALVVVVGRISGPTNQASSSRSIEGRYAIWQSGIVVFRRDWVGGTGFGALMMPVEESHDRTPGKRIYIVENESKSVLLTWLDEMGVYGGLLFLLFVVSISFAVVSGGTPAIGIGGAWVAVFIAGVFDTVFGLADRSCGNVLFGFLLGCMALLTPTKSVGVEEER